MNRPRRRVMLDGPNSKSPGGERFRLWTLSQGKRAGAGERPPQASSQKNKRQDQESGPVRPRCLGSVGDCVGPGPPPARIAGIIQEAYRRVRSRGSVGKQTATGLVTQAGSHDLWSQVETA